MSKLALEILRHLRENEWADFNWEEIIDWFDVDFWIGQGFDIYDDEDTSLPDALLNALDELVAEGWLQSTWEPGNYYFDGTLKVSFPRLMDTVQAFVNSMEDCGPCPLHEECAWVHKREKCETCGDFIIEHYLKIESEED